MSTITAILGPAADRILHVPLPETCRKLPIRIKAELEPAESGAVDATEPLIRKFVPKATPEMLAARSEALAQLRTMGD